MNAITWLFPELLSQEQKNQNRYQDSYNRQIKAGEDPAMAHRVATMIMETWDPRNYTK